MIRWLIVALMLTGCGVTQWQRDQDAKAAMWGILQQIDDPELVRAVEEAKR